jgi:hypothetical protein
MDESSFRHWARRAAGRAVDYRVSLAGRPVRPRIESGSVARACLLAHRGARVDGVLRRP